MKYLVVLDANTAVGDSFVKGKHDGLDHSGHPILDCISIEYGPSFLFVVRDMVRHDKGTMRIHVPYAAVAYIVEYAADEPRPFGFRAP